jgi:hypothetical protein
MTSRTNHRSARERGQVAMIFALFLPVLLALSGAVIGIGNWYVHAKNLQTKADSGALAGGNVWSFPCSSNTDTTIANQARLYAGPSSAPPTASPGLNPQVGKVGTSQIHTVLNGDQWYDDDGNPAPAEFNSPSGSVCDARILDVKMTEDNSFPLASLIPLFPDIKRKARVQIEEGTSFSGGLLPIAVRVPKPVSAAALYVNETVGDPNYGRIVAAHYFNDVCEPPAFANCIGSFPSALDQWNTDDGSGGNRADILNMPAHTGVVIAFSFRPACGAGPAPCFSINTTTYPTANAMCNQGTSDLVQCYYTTTSGSTQTVQSGLQFIRSYSANADAPPDLLGVWFDAASGTNCYQGAYFSAPVANSCNALLHADIDPGFGGVGNYEIRYKLVSGNTSWQEDDAPGPCNNNFGANCDMTSGVANVQLDQAYARHAVAIAIYRYNIPLAVRQANGLPPDCGNASRTDACSWYFPDNGGAARGFNNPPTTSVGNANIFSHPVQRAFMGDLNKSGPVKFLHLYNVDCTTGAVIAGIGETGQAASVLAGRRCFKLEMGLTGALAREQDEVPIQLNIGATSQSAVVDCDPSIANIKDEIVQGCGGDDGFPTYKRHDFVNTPYCPTVSGANQFFSLPQPFPWDGWAPFTCILTQTSATPNQVIQGLNDRFFGNPSSPSCPADNAQFVRGRNYWHDLNNEFFGDPDGAGPEPIQNDYFTFTRTSRGHANHLRNDDPRFVLLFITPYNSFTGNGNETFPISLIGGFYITGYGSINGSGAFTNEDPCATGSGGAIGAGNTPPPDLDTSTAGAVAWGHFVVPVDLGSSGGGNGQLCQPGTPTACVAVLIE